MGGSRGIGAAIARSFAAAGAKVAISYRSRVDEAQAIVGDLNARGQHAMAFACDVADATSCEAAFRRIEIDLGGVDILVNNAGIIADNLFLMLDDSEWRKVFDTNVMGAVRCSRLVLKNMLRRRWGRIINLSSVAATKGGRGQSNYAASKAAIEAMTRSLACEVGRRGITVNCLAPGVITTDMTDEVRRLAEQEIVDRLLIKRFGTSEEVAGWAVFLAFDFGAYMTGQVVSVDGGLKMA